MRIRGRCRKLRTICTPHHTIVESAGGGHRGAGLLFGAVPSLLIWDLQQDGDNNVACPITGRRVVYDTKSFCHANRGQSTTFANPMPIDTLNN